MGTKKRDLPPALLCDTVAPMRQETVVRQVVAQLGITLRELGRRANLSPGYMQDLMHGRALPSHGATKRLVIATGGRISFDEIMQWEKAG